MRTISVVFPPFVNTGAGWAPLSFTLALIRASPGGSGHDFLPYPLFAIHFLKSTAQFGTLRSEAKNDRYTSILMES
jgi:hypothetical protein